MNSVQRRLFRAFVKSGGDLTEEGAVDRLIRCVNSNVLILPPKVKMALDLALSAEESLHYSTLAASLSKTEESRVTPMAFRQRVSRGLRLLEEVIQKQRWSSGTHRDHARHPV